MSAAIKPETVAAINRYVTEGIMPGRFLQAVLANDLSGAFGYADPENREALYEVVKHVHNRIPGACWGSREVMEQWIKAKVEARQCASA